MMITNWALMMMMTNWRCYYTDDDDSCGDWWWCPDPGTRSLWFLDVIDLTTSSYYYYYYFILHRQFVMHSIEDKIIILIWCYRCNVWLWSHSSQILNHLLMTETGWESTMHFISIDSIIIIMLDHLTVIVSRSYYYYYIKQDQFRIDRTATSTTRASTTASRKTS